MNEEYKKEFEEIKELIRTKSPRFEASVIQGSNNNNGDPRYILYITKPVKMLNLQKGDKIVYYIDSFQRDEVRIKQSQAEKKPEAPPPKPKDEPVPITEEEQDFLVKFKDAKETKPGLVDFIKNNAVKQFGEKRVDELLESIKPKEEENADI